MAFQARHRWIIQQLQTSFGFEDEIEVERQMKTNHVMENLAKFFRADGPLKIFFYFQIRRKEALGFPASGPSGAGSGANRVAETEASEPTHTNQEGTATSTANDLIANAQALYKNKELFITDGESEPLLDKAVYFVKNPKYPETNVAIDPATAEDDLLSYGVINESALLSVETLLAEVYQPILETQDPIQWGVAEDEARNEFLGGLRSFITEIQESLKSMSAGLELRKPDLKYDITNANDARNFVRLASNDDAVFHFIELLQDWCKQMESYLDDSDQGRWESPDSGPSTELEYWKRRLQRLTGITEQLKTKECKMVIGVLTAVTKQQHSTTVDKQEIFTLLRQWKQIDINLTEAANEAKDNVKYLATLEKFIEPLYNGSPASVIDALPALMNSVKMIHTIARYYNTTERMTKLFMKITNQMITLCKSALLQGNVVNTSCDRIWDRNPQELLVDLEACLRLNEAYQETYRMTKDKLLTMPKGKQFDFSETQIFGKFDLFCRRVIKLIDMFSTIHQFNALAEHSLEGMDSLIANFASIVAEFKSHKHDLLDYHNNKFDRDYVEFNVRISDLESSLQHFINQSFESITSIEQSLSLLKQFQSILQRESLRNDLDSKFTVIFHNYGLELTTVQEIYEKFRHSPPIARNMPPVAGNILWSRHLLKRIEDPMRRFESNPNVLATKDSKKIIRTYNKVARTLVAFEYLWYEAWCKSIETAKAGLHATLIICHPETKKPYVNFDKEILQLIREAKCLHRIGIEIPENAKMVMLQEEKFKAYYNELNYTLKEYDRVISKIIPVTSSLLQPHLADLELKLRPGMITLTWTSMNIDAYKANVHHGLQRLEEMINTINDIIENRIEKNLKVISQAILVNLPTDQSFALDDFVRMQERHGTAITTMLSAKNTEVENALEDVLQIIVNYPLDAANIPPISPDALNFLRNHYKNLMYRALLNCTKQSLNAIKKRVCSKAGTGFLFLERPFFEVDVQLSVPSVRLSPSLVDVQRSINRSAVAVLKCSKNIYMWGQQQLPENERSTYFEKLGCDTEIIKVAILLTGALHGTKNQVHTCLATFKKYDWLWKEDMELRYNQFMKRNPTIQDFENELTNFMNVEAEINQIAPVHNIAALSLNTKNLKLQLRNECRQWKVQYSDRVHQQARTAMTNLMDYIRLTNTKLGREVDSLDTLRFVMNVLKEVRERESAIEMEITPILDMYQMLESYLPGGYMDKEEMDQKSIIRSSWRKLVDYAEEVTDNLSEVQGVFKQQLMKDVKEFQVDVTNFRKDYNANGPMVSGLKPSEAVERLNRFKDEMLIRERKLEVYSAGEELFAMRPTKYPELVMTKKELGLLDQLYGLYMDVVKTFEEYNDILWADVRNKLEEMMSTVSSFDLRCKRLPSRLHEWEAYHLLRKDIVEFQSMLPLIQELSKPSIKSRHWQEIIRITNTEFNVESELFKLRTILTNDVLLPNKEDIEFVCESADRQLQIETKLSDICEHWASNAFEFNIWRSRDVPVLKGFARIIEDLEEAQLQLQTMLSMRHVVPFKDEVQSKLAQLSDTADTLELWIKVQMLWMSLESVFTGGDIAKQMPVEAKKFAKIDKNWIKVMTKASETGNVVHCCANELLRNTLPILYDELEKCQKSLEGYLEQKRNKFPRFYFVSNPVLLQILSRGSDPLAMQFYYEKVYDSIDQVLHDRYDKSKIVAMKSISGADEEVIQLSKAVTAEGNIEDWLLKLEKQMQLTMKDLCQSAAAESTTNLELKEFVDKTCGQFALLGIQFNWTALCQEALIKCRQTKGIMQETNKKHAAILSELSSWCLTDLKTKLNRTKIETLITIQVHQRDCFNDLVKLYKERKLQDVSDFEWLKQARFYWKPGSSNSDRHGPGMCQIAICDVEFKYSFEYLGCKERLVITPLTDRAYITLSQALGMYLGGAPAGPAGTGKTETVKDLGRALGIYVVVTNCTDQQRYTDMAKIFKGLCQAGLWGCFDEFNRIELPVLSVVAQQVLAITSAKRVNAASFCFPGDSQVIGLNPDVGYFITMNPGYQGRQELPENLKALFRGVAMMVPDREIIMKVKLCSVGYSNFSDLARKFKTLYALCDEQLSKQKHYDFGLRNILSVLRTAGKTKRDNTGIDEEILLMRTLRDMNLSKLVAQDIPLFLSLLKDLFPNVQPQDPQNQASQHQAIEEHIATVLHQNKKIGQSQWKIKIIQLYETTLVRHGIMLVGPTGTGKSEILKSLQATLSMATQISHKQIRMNPKAIRAEEMFGETDKLSGEWLDGVFASMWNKFNDRLRKDNTWIICDGPVDAIWIENLNTVLDDNKILTLANGDRIPMTENCKLMFEVEDLRNASPATVSRAGIIYVSASDLTWHAVAEGWLVSRPEAQAKFIKEALSKFFTTETSTAAGGVAPDADLFNFLYRHCKLILHKNRVSLMQSCLELLSGLLKDAELSESHADMEGELERLVIFSIAWTLGGLVNDLDRLQLHEKMATLSTNFPTQDESLCIYDYFVNSTTLEWEPWTSAEWTYPEVAFDEAPEFASLIIPTIDSTRAVFLMYNLHKQRRPVMMIGSSGTAKTTIAQLFFDQHLRPDTMALKRINFSSATTPGMFQNTIEGELDKRGGKNFGPPGGKYMTVFLDDVSMPELNEWQDQPTLEIVRQLIESGGMCFLDKDKRGDFKIIEDLQYVAAMNHPGSGKNDIPNRLKRHFFTFNLDMPSNDTIHSIYGQMLIGRFKRPGMQVTKTNPLGSLIECSKQITTATIELWNWIKKTLLPTPTKFHYLFNMRELSRVFQGMLRLPLSAFGCFEDDAVATSSSATSIIKADRLLLTKLWRHECERVFSDKLTTLSDKDLFLEQLNALCETTLSLTHSVVSQLSNAPFVNFLRDDIYDEDGVLEQEAPKIYEYGTSYDATLQRVNHLVDEHDKAIAESASSSSKACPKLILFNDALSHLLRISRVLGMPRGNLLLVGVGGSGKQSLTRLASLIARHELFQITLTKVYNANSFLDDLRAMYKTCGQLNKELTFLFTDAEIKQETFLEFLNSVLMTGEVTNLFPKDELTIMAAELRSSMTKDRNAGSNPELSDTTENMIKCFIDRVRDNLHVVLCMSPLDPKFADRCRKFPALINECAIDWFLPWPEEALISVSRGFIGDFNLLECTADVKEQLILHMGSVHGMVVEASANYFAKMRRHVYQTPKSFLSFLTSYKVLYASKLDEIRQKETRINLGLQKLIKGAEDVESMKINLKEEEKKLNEAEVEANAMLGHLEMKSMEAKKESDVVQKIKEKCQADANKIGQEKVLAEQDLAKAQPYVDEAERAVSSIRPNDLNELKKLAKPGDIIKLIFDCVAILKMHPLVKVEKNSVTLGIGKEKRTFLFILDSYTIIKAGMLSDARFLQNIFHFSTYEKDFINDETIELMMPYLDIEEFNAAVAKNASKAAEGLCCWVRAMSMYQDASKVVKPKLEALRIAEGRLEAAQSELAVAESKLLACQDVLNKLQEDFESRMAEKAKIEQNAIKTRKKMEQATALIDGLAGERQRWSEDSKKFADFKSKLVGDCALACAFVSYCGPFNRDFRDMLVYEAFAQDLKTRKVPVSLALELTTFLVDMGTVSDWNVQGLPTDPLSIQNGILVTRSSRFPLLIDPQGQALTWVQNKEEDNLPAFGTTTLANPKLKDHVEYCMTEGKALILHSIEQDVDPMLSPVLEKNFVYRAKAKYIILGDKPVEFNDAFRLYMTTRLANPHFSPELQAKTTIVDFTVTQKGLGEQLLGKVIQKEQKSLEEQLQLVQLEVNVNTKALFQLDALLLERLTANEGNLLDDLELISVLADTKSKAIEVNEKLMSAADMKKGINEKREQYRPVATRGSVLYFCIVDFTAVNSMYQTSLDQFLELFNRSMDCAERAALASKRVNNIIDSLTYIVYRYVRRGLYEQDKLSFILMMTLKILVTAANLYPQDVMLFLKAGTSLDANAVKKKPFNWMSQQSWLNVIQLATEEAFFKSIVTDLERNENLWRKWYEDNEPEKLPLPDYENLLSEASLAGGGPGTTKDGAPKAVKTGPKSVHFLRLLLIRALREDRTILAVNQFVRATETVVDVRDGSTSTQALAALGPRYVEPVTDTVESVFNEMTAETPVIYLLSAGADPTESIELLARKKRCSVQCVSMGEGQEPVALKAMNTAMVNGSWVLLQNCHLGLGFMEGLEDLSVKMKETRSEDFRLFITADPHPLFPIALLQKSIKVTNEPPAGLRAGMLRSYTVLVDQDKLERIDTSQWRALVYILCFLHSIVQERRKFGPLGWNIPYEFNTSDLSASITFLEKHLYAGNLSWSTLQYMVAEVQYGGRITDDVDRILFNTYGESWLSLPTLAPNFSFNPETPVGQIPNEFLYSVPDATELEEYQRFIARFPDVDSPEVFGLHPNADLTFRVKEVNSLLNTLLETQPKQQSSGSGSTREELVMEKAEELLSKMPEEYLEDHYMDAIKKMGGLNVPLNVFLFQEIQCLQCVIKVVNSSLHELQHAIKGEVAMTPSILSTIQSIYDAKVPQAWMYRSGSGDELSWISSTLGIWFSGLLLRDSQLRKWLADGRPNCFWMTGMFNPQGFLTSMRQEVTRLHQADKWALDDVVFHTEVTEFERPEQVRQPPREGVFLHGLFLDGAGWNKNEGTLTESAPKAMFTSLPVLYVTAVTKLQKKNRAGDSGPYGGYECPCYKYPSRTGRYIIFTVTMPSRDHRPTHWILRGVALLCCVD